MGNGAVGKGLTVDGGVFFVGQDNASNPTCNWAAKA